MVKGNRGNVCKGAAVILVGMLLLLSVLVGSGPWNTSADAEDIPGGVF